MPNAGAINKAIDNTSKAFKEVMGLFGGKTAGNSLESLLGQDSGLLNKDDLKNLWSCNAQDWYEVFGYQFIVKQKINPPPKEKSGDSLTTGIAKFVKKVVDYFSDADSASDQQSFYYFTLPIPPTSKIINAVFPSKATATFGGVAEEVSPVKFWNIALEGTTGTGIGRDESDEIQRKRMSTKFRKVITTTGLMDGFYAQARLISNKTVGLLDRAVDVVDVTKSDYEAATSGSLRAFARSAADAAHHLKGAINDTLTPPLPYASSGVDNVRNGFKEAQELQRFYYIYHMLRGKYPKKYELYYADIKTDQVWRVTIEHFSLKQNAQNPNLWKYSIKLKGWDVRSYKDFTALSEEDYEAYDRFGPRGDLREVNAVDSRKLPELLAKFGKNLTRI